MALPLKVRDRGRSALQLQADLAHAAEALLVRRQSGREQGRVLAFDGRAERREHPRRVPGVLVVGGVEVAEPGAVGKPRFVKPEAVALDEQGVERGQATW